MDEMFESIKIGIASPEQVRNWSYGEVTKPETINYRTLKPEKDGLFCERIFGPTKDWECHCGKYKRVRYKGKICERCGVEITRAKVRRERMGHIELACPVSHIWYFKGTPSRLGIMLDVSPRNLEKVLYYAAYIVTDPGRTALLKYQILTETEYQEFREKYEDEFKAMMGAEAVRDLLAEIDLEKLSNELREEIEACNGQKKARLLKRLEVVEAFRLSGNRPEWMILEALPVIPPELRPMVQLDGGRFATSDLNDLYRRVINRNNRLKRLMELGAPDIIIRNEKRMLQEAVDALIDNGRRGRPVTGPNNRALKSLSDMLKGKQGRFRQNLLGKRVDYSGRSVIVVGPEMKIYQCGLPKEMALELFKPFVMKKLCDDGLANNIKGAKKMVERSYNEVWDALEFVIKDHPVMLNRAPTLHRLGIQAFEPVLVEGRAIKLHPLVCTAFNADFDGDQMAVHVPLSAEAQAEARYLMLSSNNLLKPQDGSPVAVPSQDMVLGAYYLTYTKDGVLGEGKCFRNKDEALMAYDNHEVDIHAKIKVRVSKEQYGIIDTTVGRIIFNEAVPQDLGMVDRSKPENKFADEIQQKCGKKQLGKIVDLCIQKHGAAVAAEVLDSIKALGYKYATRGAFTMSFADMVVPDNKWEIIESYQQKVDKVQKQFKRGLLTEKDRYQSTVNLWNECTDEVTKAVKQSFDEFNPIFMMADSGARGSFNQIRQLAGMRGLMAKPSGAPIEIPIRSNFREGLSVLEYFISSRGARKGLADTALRTADSGYLTRRLVDVAQDVIVREEDCGTDDFTLVSEITTGKEVIEPFKDRLVGRYLAENIVVNGELIADTEHLIDSEIADRIIAAGVKEAKIRSALTCHARHGICAKCYGSDLATGEKATIGQTVGIIAAQSIGEPGTQLTMRTFHTGGVAQAEDITQGLPRVEELFEARRPKKTAILAEIAGNITVIPEGKESKLAHVIIESDPADLKEGETADRRDVAIPYGLTIIKSILSGEVTKVAKGDRLTEGDPAPKDVMDILGEHAVQRYFIQEVQRVYRLQGIGINDRHIEIIVRQMMRRHIVLESGSTSLIQNSLVDKYEVEKLNKEIQARMDAGEEGLALAVTTPVLQGITKASLETESFLSAASFQETTRVLTDAATKGKVDPLIGLKENVIIGSLIPAGTGMKRYRDVKLVHEGECAEEATETVEEAVVGE